MSTGTEHVPTLPAPSPSSGTRATAPSTGPLGLVRRYIWWILALVDVGVAAAIVLSAHTSPGFDPYGWLDWGYQTLRLNLNLGGAPSWKPVSFLFTLPYSVFGHVAYWMWMVTAAAWALWGPVVAGRIVFRLVQRSAAPVWAAASGAVFAGVMILGIQQYTHYWLSSQSDPMLLTMFLMAIDMALLRRHRWAFTFLFLCSIGRPETWPFIGLYFLWAWRQVPGMRLFMVVELVLIPALWFGVPVLSGNYWDIAGKIAEHSPRELHSNKILGTITRFRQLTSWPVEVLAGIGLIWAAWRRDWRVLGVAGCAALWMAIEIGFSLHGFPGVPRYMFEAVGAEIVVAGIAVGWLVGLPWRPSPGGALSRFGAAPAALGLAGALAAVALVITPLHTQYTIEQRDLIHERARTTEIHRLDATLKALGGPAFVASCGDPSADVEYVSILAWYEHMNVGKVGHRPHFEIYVQKKPAVLFTALPSGWIVHTYHLTKAQRTRCAGLNNALYYVDAAHPGGTLTHKS